MEILALKHWFKNQNILKTNYALCIDVNCVKYARIRVSFDLYSPKYFIRYNTGQRKPVYIAFLRHDHHSLFHDRGLYHIALQINGLVSI